MNAYALVAPFQEAFSTTELAQKVKSEGVSDFARLWDGASNTLFIEKGKALYLYGGRKALKAALLRAGNKTFEGSYPMALFRAQRRVGLSGAKAKQLLMLTIPPTNAAAANQLMNRIVGSLGFGTDLGARLLGNTIGDLPKQV